jgi:hypothetical protein
MPGAMPAMPGALPAMPGALPAMPGALPALQCVEGLGASRSERQCPPWRRAAKATRRAAPSGSERAHQGNDANAANDAMRL